MHKFSHSLSALRYGWWTNLFFQDDCYVKLFPEVSHGWTIRYKIEDAMAVKAADESHQILLEWFAKHVKWKALFDESLPCELFIHPLLRLLPVLRGHALLIIIGIKSGQYRGRNDS